MTLLQLRLVNNGRARPGRRGEGRDSALTTQRTSIDFVGIGAAKSGTTWLAAMLMQHPDIFIPPQKEIHYFNRLCHEEPGLENPNRRLPVDWYLAHFREARPDQIAGEISPLYFWNENCPHDIHAFAPEARILVMLRDPVTRLLSWYHHGVRLGYATEPTFEQHLRNRPDLVEHSLYYRALKRYYDVFAPEKIGVFLFEDMVEDNRRLLREVQTFLGVETWIPEDIDATVNEGGTSRFLRLNRFLARSRLYLRRKRWHSAIQVVRAMGISRLAQSISRWNARPFGARPEVAEQTARELRAYFKDDVQQLEQLLGRDLSIWMPDADAASLTTTESSA